MAGNPPCRPRIGAMESVTAMLIVLFVLAIGANAIVGRLGGLDSIKRF